MIADNPIVQIRTDAVCRRCGPVGLVACAALLVLGCGKAGLDDPIPTETTIKLLDPGEEPRKALRYQFQAGQSQKMITEMSMAMAIDLGNRKQPEVPTPTTRMTMTINSKEVSPQGDLTYAFTLDEVEVLADGANPLMVNMMKKQMDSMVGMSGSATVTSRGFTKDAEFRLPSGLDPQMKQFMDNMNQSIKNMSAPLPEEPVGKGARWQVTMPIQTPALKIVQVATYTVSEMHGDSVKCRVTIEQSAPEQEMNVPGAAGAKAKLESFDSSGEGTVELKLTSLVPTSDLNMKTSSVISANKQKVKTTVRLGMKIHP